MKKLLIIEDDAGLREGIALALSDLNLPDTRQMLFPELTIAQSAGSSLRYNKGI